MTEAQREEGMHFRLITMLLKQETMSNSCEVSKDIQTPCLSSDVTAT